MKREEALSTHYDVFSLEIQTQQQAEVTSVFKMLSGQVLAIVALRFNPSAIKIHILI